MALTFRILSVMLKLARYEVTLVEATLEACFLTEQPEYLIEHKATIVIRSM
jgi:hypothetical protein